METHIHTDGGCWGNPGPGGWACIIEFPGGKKIFSGGEAATTNNRMELTAVIKALEYVCGDPELSESAVTINTDSQYVQKGITQWIHTWKKNGWKTGAKKPVKNQDLWQVLDRKAETLSIQWHWVKGHSGNTNNELCDELVQQAISAVEKQML